jgi:hypothetical protein
VFSAERRKFNFVEYPGRVNKEIPTSNSIFERYFVIYRLDDPKELNSILS